MKKFFLIFPVLISISSFFDADADCNKDCNHKSDKYEIIEQNSDLCDCQANCDCRKNNYEKYWVQYSENNSLFFRYLTTKLDSVCPVVLVNKKKIQTFERVHPLKENFPLKICQAEIDNNRNNNIKFKDLNISTKTSNFNKISVVGDTGCITWNGKIEQKCSILSEYPFPEIAKNIANNNSDLIIHVGDYFYSKSKCINTQECFGRPYGDNLDTWKMDFLDNSEVFFKKIPISFSRGNHEKCLAGGNGWSVIFDYSKNFRECSTYSKPYSVEFDKFRLLIVDTAEAQDSLKKLKKIQL